MPAAQQRLEIRVAGDMNWSRPRWEDVPPTALRSAGLSPTGKRALFEWRGELFTVPVQATDHGATSPGRPA